VLAPLEGFADFIENAHVFSPFKSGACGCYPMPGAGRLNTMPFHKMPENHLKTGF